MGCACNTHFPLFGNVISAFCCCTDCILGDSVVWFSVFPIHVPDARQYPISTLPFLSIFFFSFRFFRILLFFFLPYYNFFCWNTECKYRSACRGSIHWRGTSFFHLACMYTYSTTNKLFMHQCTASVRSLSQPQPSLQLIQQHINISYKAATSQAF